MQLFFDSSKHRPAPKLFGEALRHFCVNLKYVPHTEEPLRYLKEIFEPIPIAWAALSPSERMNLGCLAEPAIKNIEACGQAHKRFLQLRANELADLPHWWQRSKRRYS